MGTHNYLAVAALVACNPATAPTTTEPSAAGADSAGVSAVTSASISSGDGSAMTNEDARWTISAEGIGPIRIGAPIPDDLRTPEQYALRLYGDYQALEGFWLDGSAVFAALADGPYHRHLKSEGVGPPPEAKTLADDAVKEAVTTPVEMVYVEGSGARTEDGVGVGTGYADFVKIHPDAKVGAFPTLFEEPTCMGTVPTLPALHYFFDRCDGGDGGDVPPAGARIIRIAVR